MIYYVIKPLSEVTQEQLNACNTRTSSSARVSSSGNCVLKFDSSFSKSFMGDRWYTLEEIRVILEGEEWGESSQGFWGKVSSFFGLN